MKRQLALASLLVLAACGSIEGPPLAGSDDYVFSHWDWCPDEPTAQCPYIRMNNDLYVLEPGGRISNGPSVDIWTRRGVVVEALNLEGE